MWWCGSAFARGKDDCGAQCHLSPSVLLVFAGNVHSRRISGGRFGFQRNRDCINRVRTMPQPSETPYDACETERATHPYASTSPGRSALAFAGLVDGSCVIGMPSNPCARSSGTQSLRYSCAAFAPVVKTWAIFDRMIIGERSLGTALRILASLAPSMSHDSITSHNAIW